MIEQYCARRLPGNARKSWACAVRCFNLFFVSALFVPVGSFLVAPFSVASAHAQDISCSSGAIGGFNAILNFNVSGLIFINESGNVCNNLTTYIDGVSDNFIHIGGVIGVPRDVKIIHGGGTISNFNVTGATTIAGLAEDTAADLNTGTHTVTYNDTIDGLRTFTFTITEVGGDQNDQRLSSAAFTVSTIDTTAPTVAITDVPATVNGDFTATFTFSEDVTDFDDVGDIVVTNATVDTIIPVSASVYTAEIRPDGKGDVTVSVPAGAAEDLAATPNLSLASTVSTQFTSPQEVAQQQIRDFVGSRMGLITANRPAASRRVSRFGESGISGGETISAFGMSVANPARFALAFSGNEMSFAMRSDRVAPVFNAFAAGDGLDTADEYENDTSLTFWTEGRITLFDDDATDDGRFGIVHAGVDYLVSDRVLLGFSGQVDWLSQDNANNTGGTDGVGWLAGPTLTVQVQDNFYVDLAAALGQSYNDINPLGTYTDAFTTNRLFLSGGLIGDFEMGMYTIQPSVSVSYIVEEQEAYTDSNAALVAAQTLSQGEVRFGPRIARTFLLVGGDSLSAFASFDGVYTFGDDGDYADGSLAADMIGFTGATELGATFATRSGLALTIAGNYGGIGSDSSHYGGRLRIALPLN